MLMSFSNTSLSEADAEAFGLERARAWIDQHKAASALRPRKKALRTDGDTSAQSSKIIPIPRLQSVNDLTSD